MDATPQQGQELDLAVIGMTCASCSMRVQKHLNAVEGASATVNLALEQAHVEYDPELVDASQLIAAVEGAGYSARVLPAPGQTGHGAHHEHGDHHAHQDHQHLGIGTTRLVWALVLSTPVIAISMVPALQFTYWQWVLLALATPVVFVAGWPFHRTALRQALHGEVGMDTLVSIGSVTAWTWSVVALLALGAGRPGEHMHMSLGSAGGASDIYLEVASGVVALILLGRWLETRARSRAGDAVRSLIDLQPTRAIVIRGGEEVEVPAAEIVVLDRFVVRPGAQVPTDGIVLEGRSAIDAAAITGESVPEEVGEGSTIIGGTINTSGRLVARATRVGADTVLAQVADRVRRAQQGTASAQRLADRVSAVFVPTIIVLAIFTAAGWLIAGHSAAEAISIAVAVLIVACPCAMGLATPVALVAGTGRGAQLGILISGASTLEAVRSVGTVVFDKTGTLTRGEMQVIEVATIDGVGRADALRMAGALESSSTHPIARAVHAAARDESRGSQLPLPAVEQLVETAGEGVRGRVGEHEVAVGSIQAVAATHELPAGLEAVRSRLEHDGRGIVAVAIDGTPSALIGLSDEPREESASTVVSLHELGMRVIMLTGDRAATAAAMARRVGIAPEDVISEVLPTDKADVIEQLQAERGSVAMVGDGINDAPALAQSNLGIAIGGGSDVARHASDITLVGGDIALVPDAIRLARRTLGTIQGNLVWAFGYNLLAVPFAMTGRLNPLLAGAAMAFSSLFVVLNSLRLLRFSPRSRGQAPR